MQIVLIGAGNLATHLAKALFRAGHTLSQVVSRTAQSAETLAAQVGAQPLTSVAQILPTADLYIVSVSDQALPSLIDQLPPTQGVWVHTAGSLESILFAPYTDRFGVFYPLQTFSKAKEVDFSTIPLFLEGSSPEVRTLLGEVADSLGCKSYDLDSAGRKQLHLSAVFACNFTNHLYTLAEELLAQSHLPFDVLMPLIEESVDKLHALSPLQAQTGPAVRHDRNVINAHLAALRGDKRAIYQQLTESIESHFPTAAEASTARIPYDLNKIRALLFDVDGVLSSDFIPLHPSGEPMRSANIKDGYVLQLAVKRGLQVGIITGGRTEAVRKRYEALGMQHLYMGASNKTEALADFMAKTGIRSEEILYMGDDIPDIEVMRQVGLPCSPADAVPEVLAEALYVSPVKGGYGVARDVVEQVLKSQGHWLVDDAFGW